jgi:hypothetical protein
MNLLLYNSKDLYLENLRPQFLLYPSAHSDYFPLAEKTELISVFRMEPKNVIVSYSFHTLSWKTEYQRELHPSLKKAEKPTKMTDRRSR